MSKKLLFIGMIAIIGISGFLSSNTAFAQNDDLRERINELRERGCRCGWGCFCPTRDGERPRWREEMSDEEFERMMERFRN
jgi:hypothetical protein